MVKCRRTKRPQFMSKKWIYYWKKVVSESLRGNTDTHTSWSTVKNHFFKKYLDAVQYRSSFLIYQRVLSQACFSQHPWHLQGRKLIIPSLPQVRQPHHPWHLPSCQGKVWIDKNGMAAQDWDPCHTDVPEWLHEFRENFGDARVSERRDLHASFSHVSLEATRSADRGKHSVCGHFQKDRNGEICHRTKITMVPCRRRIGRAVPLAENFGDLITADHKVLSEGCESRNNYRYAFVVQDLATQLVQSCPCKSKTSQVTQTSSQKFLEPNWNHCTLTPNRSKTSGIAERGGRRVKEGTSAVLLQSDLNEIWWADSMECYTYLRNIQDLLSDGQTPYEKRFGETFKGPIIPFGSLV